MTFRMLAVLAWAAGFLVVVEVALEWRAHGRGFPTILFGDRPTAVATTSGPDADSIFFGPRPGFPFRNAIVPAEKRSGVTRVWISSSSYAEAMNVRAEETFVNRLPAMMKACGRDVETLDPLSRGGADIPAVTAELLEMGPTWKPDVAFLYQMSNDITGVSKSIFGGAGAAASDEPAGAAVAIEEAPNFTVTSVHSTTVFEQLKTQVTARLAQARILESELGAAGDRVFAARLRAWIAACRARGVTPVLSTFATSHDRRHRDDFPDKVATQLFTYNLYLSIDGWLSTIDRWNETTVRVAKEEGIAVADIRAVLSGRPEHYVDFFHWTPEGHRIFAQTLAKTLCGLPASKTEPPGR